jgi:phosphoinositide-3-kinase regulatory subunit 4
MKCSSYLESIDLSQSVDNQTSQPWRPKENIVISTMYEHTQAVNRLAVSPDQSFFVSASNDNTAKVWQTRGTERNAFPRFYF